MKRLVPVVAVLFLLSSAPLYAAPRRDESQSWLSKVVKVVKRIISPLDAQDPSFPKP